MTAAWVEDSREVTLFTRDLAPHKAWLEDPGVHKVGFNLLQYDLFALANEGVRLAGVTCDLTELSRVYNPSTVWGHSAKDWAKRLGITQSSYKELCARPGKSLRTPGYSLDELWEVDSRRIQEYAMNDAKIALVTWQRLFQLA